MDFKSFQNIILQNGYEHEYYNMIFRILSNENSVISYDNRRELLSIIKEQNFYHYSYTSHVRDYDSKGFLDSFSSLNDFNNSNKILYNENEYQSFLNQNLFPIIKGELENYFTKGTMIYKSYDDYTDQQRDINITFFSPLGLYNLFKINDFFTNIQDSILLDKILTIENEFSHTENPIIKEGISILDESLKNPKNFSAFVDFWAKYKKMLLPSNAIESDLDIVFRVSPELHTTYCNYVGKPGINYEFEKSILSNKITQFYFEQFETFTSYEGKIPNPLVWIYESRKFLSTQKFIDNIEEKHFEYFKKFNHSSFFRKFITDVLFSQRFTKEISLSKNKNLLIKNFNFENLFEKFEINNPEISDISNFENYLLSLNNELLPFYRSVKLENKMPIKNISIKKHKI